MSAIAGRCVQVLVLLVFFQSSYGICPAQCSCSDCGSLPEFPGNKSLVCDFSNFTELNQITNPEEICSLNLSRNEIRMVMQQTPFVKLTRLRNLYLDHNQISAIDERAFQGFGNLTNLFLDHNKLVALTRGTFHGLVSLRYLSLAYNALKSWTGILNVAMPQLSYLDVEGNKELILSETLLADTTLKSIKGASISTDCRDCDLYRANVSRDKLLPRRSCQYIPDEHMSFVDEHQARFILFKGQCAKKECEISLTDIDPVRKIYKDMCWAKVRDIRPTEIVLGSVVVLLNLFVIVGTLLSQPLRRKTSFTLIAHLAFCDLLLGVYSISVATGHGIDDDPSFRRWRVSHCPYYRTVFVLGQTMGVITSLLLTLERYLAIVNFLNPSRKITRKASLIILGVCWVLAGVMCFLLQHFDNVVIRDNFMCILVQNFEVANRVLYTQGLILFLVLLYMVVFALYIHICVFVKRSKVDTGIKGETHLAKRVGLIVFTNSIFFVIPNILIVAFSAGMLNVSTKPIANALIRIWLPPMCMVFNASLNPILFALRNKTFTGEIKKIFKSIFGKAGRDEAPITHYSQMETEWFEMQRK